MYLKILINKSSKIQIAAILYLKYDISKLLIYSKQHIAKTTLKRYFVV